MGKQFSEISDSHKKFIEDQKIFFVGTATADSRVNVSPKGMDSFQVLGKNTIAWLNVTGSSNESAAHVQESPRMTIMFCAFEGKPLILRLFGQAQVIHHNDEKWDKMYALFNPIAGARQIFLMDVEIVQTSCGMSIPFYEYTEQREELTSWAENLGNEGIEAYWEKNNQISLDGKETHIMEKNISKT